MESTTCYGDHMVKLIWKLSGNLIYQVFAIKAPGKVHITFAMKSP